MAHFAKLDDNNTITQVIVVSDADCKDSSGNEVEAIGVAFCNNLLGGRWVQTSYNGNIRKRYAGIGYSYNEQYDVFIAPKPFNSWTLNTTTFDWDPPVPYPTEDSDPENPRYYTWNEANQTWDLNDAYIL
jgi:hypothetical protein